MLNSSLLFQNTLPHLQKWVCQYLWAFSVFWCFYANHVYGYGQWKKTNRTLRKTPTQLHVQYDVWFFGKIKMCVLLFQRLNFLIWPETWNMMTNISNVHYAQLWLSDVYFVNVRFLCHFSYFSNVILTFCFRKLTISYCHIPLSRLSSFCRQCSNFSNVNFAILEI